MEVVKFKCYKITCHGRDYQILMPEYIPQFWVTRWLCVGHWFCGGVEVADTDVNIDGNREGLKIFRDACAAVSLKEISAVYFPCRKNEGGMPVKRNRNV